ncbi:MAG: ABC transporter ATP-binding protein [bacterium]|nr:ABC transporter ATP-binding protein [bacterium]
MSVIIEAKELARWYGEVVGLNDLTVTIGPGITGLVGPNGAGKSTFMKLIVGEIRPSRGSIQVLGHVPFANRALYAQIGFCPQQDALYDHMTGRQFVASFLRLAGFGRQEADARAVSAMERVHLADAMNRKVGGYSKGMRQRTRLAQSIAHDFELLIVDEPLTGLDPVARHRMLELFRQLKDEGKAVLLSSHVLHEVESLTEEIVLIHRGRLLAQGSVREVRKLLSHHPRRVRMRAREPRRLAEACLRFDHVGAIHLDEDGEGIAIETRDVGTFFDELPLLAAELRAGLRSLESPDANLEAVFDYLVG